MGLSELCGREHSSHSCGREEVFARLVDRRSEKEGREGGRDRRSEKEGKREGEGRSEKEEESEGEEEGDTGTVSERSGEKESRRVYE